jgi:hypothetical protein
MVGVAAHGGLAERKACVVNFGQTSFEGNFGGNGCIVFIFADSFFFKVPSKHDFGG